VRWIVRGDIDGFFGLAIDNLVQLLLIDALCRGVLGFPPELVYGRILPGAAISILVGNLAYALQARRLAARTGRTDVCALPYGINTVSLFAHVFLVMLPAKTLAIAAGAADPVRIAWQAGLFATFASGVIELACAPVAERLRRITPRAALLSTLAGIALSFISLGFLFRTFARPVVGLTTLAIVMLTYFGRVRFKGRMPGGVLAVSVGTALAWFTGIAPVGARPTEASLHLPIPIVGDLVAAIGGGYLWPYFSVIVAMGLFNVLGSLQNIESAEAAGDPYETRRSLTINGFGSVAAALFGSTFRRRSISGTPGGRRSARAPGTRS
jgi:AGZA family xanthine/uracil permease-like MFS transporter